MHRDVGLKRQPLKVQRGVWGLNFFLDSVQDFLASIAKTLQGFRLNDCMTFSAFQY